ncbi:sulfotransferase family 2 domain-containing protein [Gemmobacter serpentinus]|uniref:sulfotransferase family 2 domain-containing protein n=1 Tax=Gemmobacter serpentinus TaxID=2652247 RepID=UPI00124EF406|nr:sulfotransferase family 2 domain-containing protein [Gemmobacter serpentinus]
MLLPNRHFSPFKLFLHRPAHVAVMLNPKVLTTFTRALLTEGFRLHLGRDDPSEGRWPMLKIARRFPVAPMGDYIDFLRHPDRYETYGFVRNPYGRLASAWKNKFHDGHLKSPDGRDSAYPRSIRQSRLKPLRAFARAHGLPGGDAGTLVPFDTFLRYVATIPEGRRDHHWDSQSQVLMVDRLNYSAIWRIEDQLQEGFLALTRPLGFPEDWVMSQLERPRNPSKTAARIYTPELAALARPLCGKDLERFGYDPESWVNY